MFTRSTAPYGVNRVRSESSVVPKLRFPTKIFFISLFFLKLQSSKSGRIEQRAANRTMRDYALIGGTVNRQLHYRTSVGASARRKRETSFDRDSQGDARVGNRGNNRAAMS